MSRICPIFLKSYRLFDISTTERKLSERSLALIVFNILSKIENLFAPL